MSVFLVAFRYKNKPNISDLVAKSLPYDCFVLKSQEDIPALIREIKRKKPQFVLGMGQSRRGKLIRIERAAKNVLIKKGKIIRKGNEVLSSTLKLKRIKNTRISYNAGTYLCNYVYYKLLSAFPKHPRICFLHISKTIPFKKARTIVQNIITTIFK